MLTRWLLLVVGVVTVFSQATQADDWPQWRGPNRDGISAETGLLKEWPENGPKLLWELDSVGSGYTTPSVVGDRIYLIGNEGNDNEFVQALNVKDGTKIWSTQIGKVGNPDQRPPYPGARSTPTVVGDALYVLGSDGDLACLETAGGKIRWQHNVRKKFGGEPGVWAYSESPLVDGDVVVCAPGGSQATVLAVDKNSGEVVWKSAIPEGDSAGYASAIAIEINGVKQYVEFLSKGLVGVDAKTGKFLWRYERTAEGSPANIPTPIADANYVYSAASRSGGGLVKLVVDNDTVEVEQVYFSTNLPTGIGGAIKIGDYLYGSTRQGLVCADFVTGDVKWKDRSIGASSLLFAEGLLYLYGDNGQVALVGANPESYREKGRFTPPNQPDRGRSKAWAYPVLANGRLYLRDLGRLWCYDVRADK